MTRKEFLYLQIKQMFDMDLYALVDTYASVHMSEDEYETFCAEEAVEQMETEAMESAMDEMLEVLRASFRV